ncbi:uncharacterized protein LOC144592111 [Rhinoraja longicauda]
MVPNRFETTAKMSTVLHVNVIASDQPEPEPSCQSPPRSPSSPLGHVTSGRGTNCRRVCTRPPTVGGGRSTSIRSGLAAWPLSQRGRRTGDPAPLPQRGRRTGDPAPLPQRGRRTGDPAPLPQRGRRRRTGDPAPLPQRGRRCTYREDGNKLAILYLSASVDTNCRRVCTRPPTVGGGRSTSIRSGLAAWPALVTCSWDQPQSNPAMQTKLLPYKNNLDYHAAIYCTVKEHDW